MFLWAIPAEIAVVYKEYSIPYSFNVLIISKREILIFPDHEEK